MRNILKILHTTESKTTITKNKNIVPYHHIPPPPQNKISSVRTGKRKTIEGKGTPLNITPVEVVEADGKPGAVRAEPASTATAVE